MFQRLRKLAILGIAVAGISGAMPRASAMSQAQDQTDAQQKKDADSAAKQKDKTVKQETADNKSGDYKNSAKNTDKSAGKTGDASMSSRGLKGKKPGPPAGTPGETPATDDKKPQ